jgi:hypothetical protein
MQDTENIESKGIRYSDKVYSVIISRAGDFTGRMIDTAPTHIWRRGIPTCGLLRVTTLFQSVLTVVTGSGIVPRLSSFPPLPSYRNAYLVDSAESRGHFWSVNS